MQLKLVPAIAIYSGSYLPLSLILLVQDLEAPPASTPNLNTPAQPTHPWLSHLLDWNFDLGHPALAISFVCYCLICFVLTLLILSLAPTTHPIKILEAKHVPADIINYVIPYIVSFMSLDYKDTGKIVGFAVFLIWIFWITYKSGQIVLNPVLIAFGWKLYEVKYTFPNGKDIFTSRILSKREILPNIFYLKGDIQDVLVVRAKAGEAEENGS